MTTTKLIAALSLSLFAACSDDAGTPGDARIDAPDVDAAVPQSFKQVEHLARPGIAEALLLSNGFLAGYNATAPTFAGVPALPRGSDRHARRRATRRGLRTAAAAQRSDRASKNPRRLYWRRSRRPST